MSSQNEGPRANSPEVKRSLNEPGTVNFLLEKGVKRLEVFKPNTPLFYVFEDKTRGDRGPFRFYPADQRPSLAVVHAPVKLDFNSPLERDEDKVVIYKLYNEGGNVDLYAIDPITHQLRLVIAENKYKAYEVRKDLLFEAQDGVVPLPLKL
jgi:hypothetical protein